jgi:hypothetical protein
MSYTLDQFSAECHRTLAADPGVEGRKKVCALVREVLKDDEFVNTHLGDDVPERKILFEDPELGFCILGHVHHDVRNSNPHDHGPYWAVYGQAKGQTVMTDYFHCEVLPSLLVGVPSKNHSGRPRMPVLPPSTRRLEEVIRGP